MIPDSTFHALHSGVLTSVTTEPSLRERVLAPGLSRWDAVRNLDTLAYNENDCNWFAFEACSLDRENRFAGIIALNRTGSRLSFDLEAGSALLEDASDPLHSILASSLTPLLPLSPCFDSRPLFLAVLYDFAPDCPAEHVETPVVGRLDPDSFSFVSSDHHWQILQGSAARWRDGLPPELQRFYSADTPAFALRAEADNFEVELFLRPVKEQVVYGNNGGSEICGDGFTIFYVQRPRLELIGTVRRRGKSGAWNAPVAVRGDATQDRHSMSSIRFGLRWIWFLARFDDGRECLAYEIRTAEGGRYTRADAGDLVIGNAWLVDRDGTARQCPGWNLVPSHHLTTARGMVPRRFDLSLPSEHIRVLVEHVQPTFVPTRALGELAQAGIWESPARVVEASGITGGHFWVDVMPPWGAL